MRKLALLALLAPLAVYADPRMVVDGNYCHMLHDNQDDDNETFVADCAPNISVQGGVANGYALKEFRPLLRRTDSDGVYLSKTERYEAIITDYDFQDEVCTMVDSNGTQYKARDWETGIDVRGGSVVYWIVCRNGLEEKQ